MPGEVEIPEEAKQAVYAAQREADGALSVSQVLQAAAPSLRAQGAEEAKRELEKRLEEKKRECEEARDRYGTAGNVDSEAYWQGKGHVQRTIQRLAALAPKERLEPVVTAARLWLRGEHGSRKPGRLVDVPAARLFDALSAIDQEND